MDYLCKFCCICTNKRDLKHLFEVDSDGVSHYNKLTLSIAEMNFKEMNDQILICGECCVTLNTVYNFRQMCLRNKSNLLAYISQLQTSRHVTGTVSASLKNIKPELIVVKNRGGTENEGSNSQMKFQTESFKENICYSASIKEEYESEVDDSSAHEDATVDHVNEGAHKDVKVEDVEHDTIEDSAEYYAEFTRIDIKEDPFAVVKEEPMSDTETPQDGSTSQADTGTSEKPIGCEATTVGTEPTQNTEKDGEELHQCEICQKSFNRRNTLMKHMKTHSSETSYECEVCKKIFSYMCYLSIHMAAHADERPHVCEICNKGFKHKENLNAHRKTHSSERPYECEICKKDFKHKGNLTGHMKSHSSERPFECEICKKGFKHKDNLTAHMKIHSSERPFECEICKKRFYNKSNLNVHMKIHSSDRPYECEICKKRFEKKASCSWHMKRHFDEKSQ